MRAASESTVRRRGARAQGFTVLEVLVSSAIIALVSSLIIGVLVNALRSSAEIHMVTTGSIATGHIADDVARNLQKGVVVHDVQVRFIEFQEPVDWDADGDVTDDVGNLELGADGQLDWTYFYEFQPTGSLAEDVNQLDLNEDGDLSDTFDVGEVVLKIKDENLVVQETRAVTGGQSVIQPQGGVTDPAVPDMFKEPYFSVEAIEVNVVRLNDIPLTGSDGPRIFRSRRLVTFR